MHKIYTITRIKNEECQNQLKEPFYSNGILQHKTFTLKMNKKLAANTVLRDKYFKRETKWPKGHRQGYASLEGSVPLMTLFLFVCSIK